MRVRELRQLFSMIDPSPFDERDLDPDAIVLGGGLSNIDLLYREVPARLGNYVFSDRCITPVLKNLHGDSSGVRGAAWLWDEV